jgi:hypothetical protein
VLGFFGSFIAFSAFMFSRMGPGVRHFQPPTLRLMPYFYFGGVFGGLLIGAVVGSWLGGLVADLQYRRSPGSASAPRVNKVWVGAGAFMGSIVGVAIGMGLTAFFSRGLQPDWLTPVLFLSPSVLCLVLGGFAGLNFARRRAAR